MQATKTNPIAATRVPLKRVVFHKSSFDGIPPYVVATSWAAADELIATAAKASEDVGPVTIFAVVTWEDGEQEHVHLRITEPVSLGRTLHEKWDHLAGLDGDEAEELGVDMGDTTWAEWQLLTYDVDGKEAK